MLDVNYPEEIIRKAQAIAAKAEELPSPERDDFVADLCGLSYAYIKKIGTHFKQPSNRTLMNLGYELLARDVATGEIIPLEMNIKCDWNPRNPRPNPTSIGLSIDELGTTSTTNE